MIKFHLSRAVAYMRIIELSLALILLQNSEHIDAFQYR